MLYDYCNNYQIFWLKVMLSQILTADADETKLFSRVASASAVCT